MLEQTSRKRISWATRRWRPGYQLSKPSWYDTRVLHLLLKRSANINRSNEEGKSPVAQACAAAGGHSVDLRVSVIQKLIQYEADVNQADGNGNTPAMIMHNQLNWLPWELLGLLHANLQKCMIYLNPFVRPLPSTWNHELALCACKESQQLSQLPFPGQRDSSLELHSMPVPLLRRGCSWACWEENSSPLIRGGVLRPCLEG